LSVILYQTLLIHLPELKDGRSVFRATYRGRDESRFVAFCSRPRRFNIQVTTLWKTCTGRAIRKDARLHLLVISNHTADSWSQSFVREFFFGSKTFLR